MYSSLAHAEKLQFRTVNLGKNTIVTSCFYLIQKDYLLQLTPKHLFIKVLLVAKLRLDILSQRNPCRKITILEP